MSKIYFTTQKLHYAASVFFFVLFLAPTVILFYPLFSIQKEQISYVVSHYQEPLVHTLVLSSLTGLIAVVFAVFALIAVRNISSRILRVMSSIGIALPLIFPPYIGAITYIDIFKSTLGLQLFGRSPTVEFLQAAFVLSLFLYPYTFLLLYSRLKLIDPAQLKLLSVYRLSCMQQIRMLYYPHLKATILSGFMLTFLYVVADFGAVSILRMNTLTTEVYQEIIRKFGYEESALVSILFFIIAVISMRIGKKIVGAPVQGLHVSHNMSQNVASKASLVLSLLYILLIFLITASVVIPLAKILIWYYQFLQDTSLLKSVWLQSNNYIRAALTSFMLTVLTVIGTQAGAVGIFVLSKRGARITDSIYYLTGLLHGFPGIVIAFSVLLLKLAFPQGTRVGFFFLLLAYMIRYMGIASFSLVPALEAIPPSLDRLGYTFIKRARDHIRLIVFPYIKEHVLQSSNYMYFHVLRELTIPLLLLPLGMQLLPLRIWQTANEGLYIYAAPSIVLLLALSLPSVIWYIKNHVS